MNRRTLLWSLGAGLAALAAAPLASTEAEAQHFLSTFKRGLNRRQRRRKPQLWAMNMRRRRLIAMRRGQMRRRFGNVFQ